MRDSTRTLPVQSGGRHGSRSPVVLMTALGIGLVAPVVGLSYRVLVEAQPYADPFLRVRDEAPDWLPRGTADVVSIPRLQGESLAVLFAVVLALALLLLATILLNLLTLLLARASGRWSEIAVRTVLGAAPRRLVAELVRDASGVAISGGLLGLFGGIAVATLLGASLPWNPADAPVAVAMLPAAGPVLGVVGLLGAGLFVGWLSPAVIAWRRNLQRYLTTGSRATAGGGEVLFRHCIAATQVGVLLLALVGAGLLLRSFAASRPAADALGFNPRELLTVQVEIPPAFAADPVRRADFSERLLDRVIALPGVVDSSASSPGAWVGLGATDRVRAICPECSMGLMLRMINDGPARVHSVTPDFFRTLEAPILRGRAFGPGDDGQAESVAVVNDTFAYRLFPNGDALDKRIQLGGADGNWYRVIGIVHNIRAPGLGTPGEPASAVYLSATQHPPGRLELAVRTEGDPSTYIDRVTTAMAGTDPGVLIEDPLTMDQYLDRGAAPLRWFAYLLAGLSAGVIAVAVIGMYQVTSYNVRRRTREIGIRAALGARGHRLIRMAVGQSLRITCAGIVLGVIGASGVTRLLQLAVGGAELRDPGLYLAVIGLIASITLASSFGPARRAAAIQPQACLREE